MWDHQAYTLRSCHKSHAAKALWPWSADHLDASELNRVAFKEHGAIAPEVFPNPGSDHFTFSLPHGACTLMLFAATGRDVLRAAINGDRANVNTSMPDAGLYQYVVLDADGAWLRQGKWIKE